MSGKYLSKISMYDGVERLPRRCAPRNDGFFLLVVMKWLMSAGPELSSQPRNIGLAHCYAD